CGRRVTHQKAAVISVPSQPLQRGRYLISASPVPFASGPSVQMRDQVVVYAVNTTCRSSQVQHLLPRPCDILGVASLSPGPSARPRLSAGTNCNAANTPGDSDLRERPSCRHPRTAARPVALVAAPDPPG